MDFMNFSLILDHFRHLEAEVDACSIKALQWWKHHIFVSLGIARVLEKSLEFQKNFH